MELAPVKSCTDTQVTFDLDAWDRVAVANFCDLGPQLEIAILVKSCMIKLAL